MKKLLFVISFMVSTGYSLDRLQALRFDKSKVQKIHLVPGLGSMISFPCLIEEAFLGRSEDLMVQISPKDKKILFLNLKLNSSLPTNLIVRCVIEKNIFIFDIIPNKTNHQDFVEIRNFYGRLETTNTDLNYKPSSLSPKKIVKKLPVLIQKGGK